MNEVLNKKLSYETMNQENQPYINNYLSFTGVFVQVAFFPYALILANTQFAQMVLVEIEAWWNCLLSLTFADLLNEDTKHSDITVWLRKFKKIYTKSDDGKELR